MKMRMDNFCKSMEHEVRLLQTIPGLPAQVATGIIGETAIDMDHFHSNRHIASRAGVVQVIMKAQVKYLY